MTATKKSKKPQRTIAIELHQQWQRLQRKNDSIELAKQLKVSKPTIDKALIYGSVHQQAIVDGITSYLAGRLLREKEAGEQLKRSADQVENPNLSTSIPQS